MRVTQSWFAEKEKEKKELEAQLKSFSPLPQLISPRGYGQFVKKDDPIGPVEEGYVCVLREEGQVCTSGKRAWGVCASREDGLPGPDSIRIVAISHGRTSAVAQACGLAGLELTRVAKILKDRPSWFRDC
ncbi:hypothetical protein LguiA_020686 [Lonicera macranthoides]